VDAGDIEYGRLWNSGYVYNTTVSAVPSGAMVGKRAKRGKGGDLIRKTKRQSSDEKVRTIANPAPESYPSTDQRSIVVEKGHKQKKKDGERTPSARLISRCMGAQQA